MNPTIVLSHDVSTLTLTADGSGEASVSFPLGDYHGFTVSWAYAGAGTPSISILGTNKPSATIADAHDLATGLGIDTAFGLDLNAKYATFFISVTGMINNDPDLLRAYVRRWR